jgi:hypothetical protein
MSWLQKALNASVRTDVAGMDVHANSANSAKSSPNGTKDTNRTDHHNSAAIYILPLCAAAIEERAGIAQHDGGVPRHYALAFAEFQHAYPASIAIERWQLAINDAGLFLDQWGCAAHRLGWTCFALFGQDRLAAATSAQMGLFWLLNGRRVLALTAVGAHLSDNAFIRQDQLA